MTSARTLSVFCLALVFAGIAPAAAEKYVVTVNINVESETFTCSDWFAGPVNEYLDALKSYELGVNPSVSCRQSANTVHTMELVGPEPGANLFFDDARKVSEAVGELRNLVATNRVSLFVNFYFEAASAEASQAMFTTLNAQIRNGDFLGRVGDATFPLLKAVPYQEVFSA